MDIRKYGRVELKSYAVNEETFDAILEGGYRVLVIEDLEQFDLLKYGYPDKSLIAYDGNNQLIVVDSILKRHCGGIDLEKELWYMQTLVVRDRGLKKPYVKSITGGRAYMIIKSRILKYYTKEEYDERLTMFAKEYDEHKKQFHYNVIQNRKEIVKYDNCYKFDINGAHNDALKEIFPRAAKEFDELYNTRKENPINKQYVNFYVGMLCRTGYRDTYNWIVQRTTNLLLKGIDYCGGRLLYANTDGFLIQNPAKTLEHSTTLGEFKLEYQGDAYIYYDKNYFCLQLGKEITGSVLYQVRNKIDLPNGKVVHYDRVRITEHCYSAENIVEEQL